MSKSAYLECGKIINTHGCRGGVKLESWCDTPKILADMKRIYMQEAGEMKEYKVSHSAIFRQFVLMDLDGIEDMDAAMALKNTVVYAARKDFHLKKGEYFLVDLIGLPIIDAKSGDVLGTLLETVNRGASDIYVVNTPSGERMIPVVEEFVERVDPDKGIFVNPIPGMLD